jgi:hypothetical protein
MAHITISDLTFDSDSYMNELIDGELNLIQGGSFWKDLGKVAGRAITAPTRAQIWVAKKVAGGLYDFGKGFVEGARS